MAKLIYITNTSLDGYIEDESGDFNWLDPAEAFEFVTELIRPMKTYIYGRRLYEKMSYWSGPTESYPPERREFARVWQGGEKIVFSRTLAAAATDKTRIEREFDVDLIRQLKRESPHDITIGGAEIAAPALDAGLVDECHLFVNPLVIGRGKPAFSNSSQLNLGLLETRRFSTGVVYVRYRVVGLR